MLILYRKTKAAHSKDQTIHEHNEWSKCICLNGESGGTYSYQAGF